MFKEISLKFLVYGALLVIGIGFLEVFILKFNHPMFEVFSEKIAVALITTSFISLFLMLYEYIEKKYAEKNRKSEVVSYKAVKNEFPKYMTSARHSIGICGISLRKALEKFKNDKNEDDNYFKLLRDKRLEAVDLQLLFCSPKSDYLKKRAEIEFAQIGLQTADECYKRYVHEAWQSVLDSCEVYQRYINSGHRGLLTLKIINDYALPINHLITDDIAIAGYLIRTHGDDDKSPRIIAYQGSDEYEYTKKEFDNLFGTEAAGDVFFRGDTIVFEKFDSLLKSENDDSREIEEMEGIKKFLESKRGPMGSPG
jgi:hypothetical protein